MFMNVLQEFNDKDAFGNVYAFRAMKHFCPADYYIEENGMQYIQEIQEIYILCFPGEIYTISSCEVDHEFDGVNHKTSHDGVFKVVATKMSPDILNQVGGIKVTVGGSYAPHGYNLY